MSGSTTQRTRRQHWTTQSHGQRSKNLAAPRSPRIQGAPNLSKKRPQSAGFYFSLENMQHFEGSENKLTQTRTYNVNFICIYDLTWCPVFLHSVHPNSISLHHNGITPWLVHNLDALLTFKVLYSALRYFYNNTEPTTPTAR